MCSAELDVLFLNRASDCFLFIRNSGNCLALRINSCISLMLFLLKDVKFIEFFFGISERLTTAHTFSPVLRRRVIALFGLHENQPLHLHAVEPGNLAVILAFHQDCANRLPEQT